MSFLQKAREAASQAAEGAKAAATHAADGARSLAERAQDEETQAKARDAAAHAGKQAREALGSAKRSITTVVERIDPGTLADLIIRATALQERTNRALHEKGSPYRVAELVISASIPPSVSFSIARIHEAGKPSATGLSSTEILETTGALEGTILSLDADGEVEAAPTETTEEAPPDPGPGAATDPDPGAAAGAGADPGAATDPDPGASAGGGS